MMQPAALQEQWSKSFPSEINLSVKDLPKVSLTSTGQPVSSSAHAALISLAPKPNQCLSQAKIIRSISNPSLHVNLFNCTHIFGAKPTELSLGCSQFANNVQICELKCCPRLLGAVCPSLVWLGVRLQLLRVAPTRWHTCHEQRGLP